MHSVTHVEASTEKEAMSFNPKMRTLGMRAEHSGSSGLNRMNDLDKTPESANRCRTLDAHPSGESLS